MALEMIEGRYSDQNSLENFFSKAFGSGRFRVVVSD